MMSHALLHRWTDHAERRALYWWRPKDGRTNMGDQLSQVIVSRVLGLRDLALMDKRNDGQRLFAIGSVLHFARTGDTVWGSGINGKIDEGQHRFGMLDVRAVRGPRTRQYLLARGIPVPEVYGDPGLLMPLFFPAQYLREGPARDVAVVPHFNEPLDKYRDFADLLVTPDCPPATFMRRLLGARLVVSSSLHGLVLAEAYGIPAVYLDWGNGEDLFKYDDYYAGTGRTRWHSGRSVDECLALGGNAGFDLAAVQSGLLDAFPYDLW